MGRHRKPRRPATPGQAVFLLAVGILLGTVFIFGEQYWSRSVTADDARHLTAIYESHEVALPDRLEIRADRRELIVRFTGDLRFDIPQILNSDEVEAMMDTLLPGTEVSLIVHPNSNTIMDMRTEELVILNFEESGKVLSGNSKGFFILGIFCYAIGALGASSLISRGVGYQKRRKQAVRSS